MTLAQFGALPAWEQEARIAKVARERERLGGLRDDLMSLKNAKGEMYAWTPEVAAIIQSELYVRTGKRDR